MSHINVSVRFSILKHPASVRMMRSSKLELWSLRCHGGFSIMQSFFWLIFHSVWAQVRPIKAESGSTLVELCWEKFESIAILEVLVQQQIFYLNQLNLCTCPGRNMCSMLCPTGICFHSLVLSFERGGAGRAINASNLGKVRLSAGQRTN